MNRIFLLENLNKNMNFIEIDKIIFRKKSRYQDILIAESSNLGRFLMLDGKLNSSEIDYFIYHEAIVHVAMTTLDKARRVLVIGAGEGTTIEEILKYPNVEVDWVEIDKDVILACRKYLPYSFKNYKYYKQRVNLFITDGFKFVNRTKNKYDVIIADITEPQEENGISNKLYSIDFARKIKEILSENGIYITLPWEKEKNKWRVNLTPSYLKKTFKYVRPFQFSMPSFGSGFTLIFCSNKIDPIKVSKKKIKEKIKYFEDSLFFYDEKLHYCLFTLPKYLNLLL